MKVYIVIALSSALLLGCAATYAPPPGSARPVSREFSAPQADLFGVVRAVLIQNGYRISYIDEPRGAINTEMSAQRLTPEQANCGATMGLDYLKDARTSTRVGFNITITSRSVAVLARVEGEYRPGDVDQNLMLTCISRGTMEKILLDKIAAAI